MMVSARQREILNSVVQEYIESAQPVSSQLLGRKHKFEICPATIRIEMQRLTEKGYLHQPHTSAGRVPTDKGYRFFVDGLLEKELEGFKMNWQREIEDSFSFVRDITKFLASESSNLSLGYLATEKILWKEGWGEILQEPEFTQRGFVASFAQMLDDFEKNVENLLCSETQVYIGKENPISKARDFSLIIRGFPEGIFAILGPKRMSYYKNIHLLNSLCRRI